MEQKALHRQVIRSDKRLARMDNEITRLRAELADRPPIPPGLSEALREVDLARAEVVTAQNAQLKAKEEVEKWKTKVQELCHAERQLQESCLQAERLSAQRETELMEARDQIQRTVANLEKEREQWMQQLSRAQVKEEQLISELNAAQVEMEDMQMREEARFTKRH